jgi:hypothetical protein
MGAPMIQVVFVKWGTMFAPAHVNGLCEIIRRETSASVRFVCVCDDARGLDPSIVAKPFPDYGVPFEVLIRPGYLAKIAIFDTSVLQPGLKTVFLDLDTAILGDITALTDLLDRHRALFMLPQHFVQHWRIRGLVRRIRPDKCYFASSAVMAFYPEDYSYLSDVMRRELAPNLARAGNERTALPKRFRADDHFISWFARDSLRVFPDRVVAKFQDAYTAFGVGMASLRDVLPWVVRRRRGRVALTFGGEATKPDRLLVIERGDELRFGPLVTRWNYPELKQYWLDLQELCQGDTPPRDT